MGLKEQLQREMQTAAKERSSLALSALRMAVAAIRNREIEAVTRKEMPKGGTLPEEAILKVIATMVKQRRESIALYLQGNRPELAAKEEGEIAVLERFLPKDLGESSVRHGPCHESPHAEGGGPGRRQGGERDGQAPSCGIAVPGAA
ncbi:MAG: GatB/YqeY protein [Deltaproteobacteria bacterium]|nr:GatB/YqeY protein [Deltaproteobacteria bacterium]